MKLKHFAVAFAAAAMLLTGCWQKSVYPFYKDKDVIFDEALLGDWIETDKDKEKPAKWTFTRGELPDLCRLHIEDGDTRVELDARLFKLGSGRFLDLHSRARPINEIPAHHLLRVKEIGELLKLEILSQEWVSKWTTEHPDGIPSIRESDPENPKDSDKFDTVLAADTDRLQKWVLEHINDEGFWNALGDLKKSK